MAIVMHYGGLATINTPQASAISINCPRQGGFVFMALELKAGVYPDSKVHGANMGPIWGRQGPGGPHVGPMNLAIWIVNTWVRIQRVKLLIYPQTSTISLLKFGNGYVISPTLSMDVITYSWWD